MTDVTPPAEPAGKRPYRTPDLRDLGPLAELTLTAPMNPTAFDGSGQNYVSQAAGRRD